MIAWQRILLASMMMTMAAPIGAQEALPEGPATVVGFDEDQWQRMTVSVSIEGQGPFQFVVDTGAERTAISEELARDLQLDPGKRARVHSMTEVSQIQTVLIPDLTVAGKSVRSIHAPAFQRRNIGAEGILGVDSLQSQRVSFDFARQQITVTPSRKREERWDDDTIVVTAKSRFGHLVLVDASVEGQRVWVILDTGAQTTIANSALRKKLERRNKLGLTQPIEMISVTGGRILADATVVKEIEIGSIDIRNMPIAFADVHPFKKLGLTQRPAILLGMDALRLFERVSVDFAKREVRLMRGSMSERRDVVLARAEEAPPRP